MQEGVQAQLCSMSTEQTDKCARTRALLHMPHPSFPSKATCLRHPRPCAQHPPLQLLSVGSLPR